jgi:hypothetical protein
VVATGESMGLVIKSRKAYTRELDQRHGTVGKELEGRIDENLEGRMGAGGKENKGERRRPTSFRS